MGKGQEIKGRIEKAGGEITGDENLKNRGRKDKFMGKLDQAADKLLGKNEKRGAA